MQQMHKGSSRLHAIAITAFVSLFLLVVFVGFWIFVGIPAPFQNTAFLLIGLISIALVTALIYQSFKVSASVVAAQDLAQDIAEDMHAYSKELFSELYMKSPVPYILIDVSGKIESINYSTARLFNVTVDALTDVDIFNFIQDEDVDKVALIPEYFKQNRNVNDMEVQIRRPDGGSRYVMLSLFSFTDGQGTKKGLLTLVDITKQKAIDKAKTEFVSLASHQLHTPISAMKWNLELLQTAGKDQFTEFQKIYVEKIRKGVDRMDMLVNDFLSVSKFELGTLTPSPILINIPVFLDGIIEENALFAEQKGVRVSTKFGDGLEDIKSDTHLLHMIVSNLLSNAIKYTPKDGTVEVKALILEDKLNIAIADTGMGIPLEEQEQVFSKLFRGAGARMKVTDGTGLGLYIVKRAVETLGGNITFVSVEGQGTTFTVVLPK